MTSSQTFRDPYPPPTLVPVDEQAFDQDTLDELPDVTHVVSFDYALEHLAELADEVQRDEARIAVMRDGKPAFIMMNAEVMDWLETHMELFQEPGALEALRRSHEQALAGEGVPLEQAVGEHRQARSGGAAGQSDH